MSHEILKQCGRECQGRKALRTREQISNVGFWDGRSAVLCLGAILIVILMFSFVCCVVAADGHEWQGTRSSLPQLVDAARWCCWGPYQLAQCVVSTECHARQLDRQSAAAWLAEGRSGRCTGYAVIRSRAARSACQALCCHTPQLLQR
jgi:hypothetical protein